MEKTNRVVRPLFVALVMACAVASWAAEKGGGASSGPLTALDGAKKAEYLAKESPKQKKLRQELAALKDQWVVFNYNPKGNMDIYIMRPDGSELRNLTQSKESESYPHLSPDGKKVLFQRSVKDSSLLKKLPFDKRYPLDWKRGVRKGKPFSLIWVMDLDKGDCKPVAQGSMPHWAPDGKHITYSVYKHPRQHRAAILDLEKGIEHVIDPPGVRFGGMPCFSPDMKYLLVSNGNGFLIPLDESGGDYLRGAKPSRWHPGHPCNAEISPDGKWIAWVMDTFKCEGSWLFYAPMKTALKKGTYGAKLDLGWQPRSVNYFPDFSPSCKYLVYAHGESMKGVKSWTLKKGQELFICRFPADGVSVRVTWLGGAAQHPHWWGKK